MTHYTSMVYSKVRGPSTGFFARLQAAYSLKRRDDDTALFMKRIAEKVRKEKEAGRRFSSYLDELSWPELEVLCALKGRSAAISLHSTDDEILQRTPVRKLYPLPEH